MLILGRKVGQTVVIGGDTIIRIDEIVGLSYRLTLQSPHHSFSKKLFHAGDQWKIGNLIVVYLSGSRYRRNELRISIEAPREISIDRGEVWVRKCEQRFQASRVDRSVPYEVA